MSAIRTTGKLLGFFLGLALVFSFAKPASAEQLGSELTQLKFAQPVAIPGHKTLAPGTYWFKLIDNDTAVRPMVIYNANRNKVEAIVLTRPTYRDNRTTDTELTLAEKAPRNAGPPTLVKWFYPGLHYGQALVYSAQVQKQLNEEKIMNVIAKPGAIVGG